MLGCKNGKWDRESGIAVQNIFGHIRLSYEWDREGNNILPTYHPTSLWEAIKLNESSRKSVLEGVPKSLPTLLKSWRILEKVGDLGFQWNNKIDYLKKIDEELLELKSELLMKNKINIDEEFGDFLFSIINYGRFLGINPVDSLEKTNKKFITRFKYMEHLIKLDNKKIESLSNNELEVYWNRSKSLQ